MSNKSVEVDYAQRNVEWEKTLHCTHVCVHIRCLRNGAACKEGKLDAKATKCLFLDYCMGTKAYRLMCI
jgi:hypothetical protein